MLPAYAVGVVIVVGPAEAESVLPGLLGACRTISGRPVFAFRREKQVGRPAGAEIRNGGADQLLGMVKACRIGLEEALASPKLLGVPGRRAELIVGYVGNLPALMPMSLDGPQFHITLQGNPRLAKRRVRHALHLRRPVNAASSQEVHHGIHFDGHSPWLVVAELDWREQSARMFPNHRPAAILGQDEADVAKPPFEVVAAPKAVMVHPIGQSRPGPRAGLPPILSLQRNHYRMCRITAE